MSIPTKFDRIISILALHQIRSTSHVLNEISEIFEKNGKTVIVVTILSDNSGMAPLQNKYKDKIINYNPDY